MTWHHSHKSDTSFLYNTKLVNAVRFLFGEEARQTRTTETFIFHIMIFFLPFTWMTPEFLEGHWTLQDSLFGACLDLIEKTLFSNVIFIEHFSLKTKSININDYLINYCLFNHCKCSCFLSYYTK